MLSPGKHHRKVPKDAEGNLRFRKEIFASCRRSRAARAALLGACRQDLLFYVNAFVWYYNPRNRSGSPRVGPFITWDFQDEAFLEILRSVEEDRDLLIEKSREMGASWMTLIVMEWLWHFQGWMQFLCISRNEKAVEDESPDSLFWKIDFIHSKLPAWMRPGSERRKLYFGNLDSGSTITGEASTGRAGVGGRATAMFVDEFSQIKEDYEVLHRTSDTTGCRIFNGTHCGSGTAFAELANRVDMRKLVMHWTQHPDKKPGLYRYDSETNSVEILDKTYRFPPDFEFVRSEAPAGGPHPGIRSPWYDEQCRRKGSPRAIAMDLDIDPGGSVSQFFNPLTVRALKTAYCRDPLWEGDLVYDADSGRPEALTAVPGGPIKLWLGLVDKGRIPPGRYGAGADLAAGTGATNSCLSVADMDTGEKVCEVADPNALPERFAAFCVALLLLFTTPDGVPALFAWEHCGPGLVFGKKVIELGYRNIYYREAHMTLAGGKRSDAPGWYPSNEQKLLLFQEYRAALDARTFINRSARAMDETLKFRYTAQGVEHSEEGGGDDPTGARINHGDRVVADALCCKMVRGRFRRRQPEAEAAAPGSLAWRRQLALAAPEKSGW